MAFLPSSAVKMRGTLSLNTNILVVAPILLHKTKHWHFLYFSTQYNFERNWVNSLVFFWKFPAVIFATQRYFFCPLIFSSNTFISVKKCSPISLWQIKSPTNLSFRNILGKHAVFTLSNRYTVCSFVNICKLSDCLKLLINQAGELITWLSKRKIT